MKSYDVVILHPPCSLKASPGTTLYAQMPMGQFVLGALLEKEGFEVKIVNLALEKLLNPSLDYRSFLGGIESKVYAIDLHWFVHASGSIEVAELIKDLHPDSMVVLGGFTATFFAEEILKKYKFIDAVVLGEGEIPLLELANAACSGKSIDSVRGIAFRKGSSVVLKKPVPVEDFDKLDFTRLELLENWKKYLRTGLSDYLEDRRPAYWLNIARGCCKNCVYCGGSREGYRVITGREKMVFRSPESVAEDVEVLCDKGVKLIRFSHDPELFGEDYSLKLFKEIRERGVEVYAYWESFSVPSRKVLEEAVKTFRGVDVAVSPESASEEVRFSAGREITDEALFKSLKAADELGVLIEVYFLIGLPEETPQTARMIPSFARQLIKGKKLVGVMPTIPYTIDPNCPMALNPQKYGVKVLFKSVKDYMKLWKGKSTKDFIGHETRHMSRKTIAKLTDEIFQQILMLPQENAALAKVEFEREVKSPIFFK